MSSAAPVHETRHVTPFTCATDGLEHLVTDEDWAAGRDTGTARAVDGHRVVVASSELVGRPCAACHSVLSGESSRPRMEVPDQRAPLIARLLRRRGAHAR